MDKSPHTPAHESALQRRAHQYHGQHLQRLVEPLEPVEVLQPFCVALV